MGAMAAMGGPSVWQADPRLASVLEAVFWWLGAAELSRAAAACSAWRAAAARARVWRRLLRARAADAKPADEALGALANLYDGECPWREVVVAAEAPWRRAAELRPGGARLAAAALHCGGDWLALADDDGGVSLWRADQDSSTQADWQLDGSASLAPLGWAGVARAEWAPGDIPRLLLLGRVPLAACRGALAVLEPGHEGAWRVAARAGGAGGCWASAAGFLSLELTRLSAPDQPPHFATDVWLNAVDQAPQSEFAGVAARVLRVYNEEPALVTQIVCAETPLDARAAQEWAEAEAEAAAETEEEAGADEFVRPPADAPLEEVLPGEAYYRATYQVLQRQYSTCVRLAVLACGARLLALPLADTSPPPLKVRAALADRVAARRRRREQEALEAEAPPPPPLSAAELRARCAAPAARLRLPARVLGLALHDSERCVWAVFAGGCVCASLPALRVLRAVPLAPAPAAPPHYVQPAAMEEYFGSPCGSGSGRVLVWGAAWGAGAALPHRAPALAVVLRPRGGQAPRALVLTEDALHVWESSAPRAPPPARRADDCWESNNLVNL